MWIIVATIAVFPVSAYAADAGDFANNAISDLGPLITLVGDNFTTQFLSLSFTARDCILFAMAPIGVLTAISAAIRVGNLSLLKAIIGRARESQETVEVQLLPSTSQDVCEVWNGRELVRVSGNGNVLEIVYFKPLTDIGEGLKKRICSYKEPGVMELRSPKYQIRKKPLGDCESVHSDHDSISEKTPNSAPNISLNFQDPEEYSPAMPHAKPSNVLSLATALGVVLQMGVLIVFSVVTFLPKFNGGGLSKVGFSLTFSGTLFLVIGMFICALVVKLSTKKEKWVSQGHAKFQLLWVQNRGSFADEYDSYVIFANGPRNVILTSHRKIEKTHGSKVADNVVLTSHRNVEKTHGSKAADGPDNVIPTSHRIAGKTHGSKDTYNSDKFKTNALVCTGSGFALCGFIMQLFGLRMMHWSAAVAQFGATLVMMTIRAAVRLPLSENPDSSRIPDTYELDWVAMRLERKPDETGGSNDNYSLFSDSCNRKGSKSTSQSPRNERTMSDHDKEFRGTGCWRWSVATDRVNDVASGFLTHTDPKSDAHLVLKVRKRLGVLSKQTGSKWTVKAAETAISLSNAIQTIMNLLYPPDPKNKTKYWSMPVRVKKEIQLVYFRLKWEKGEWKSSAKKIEAFLSLWLFELSSGGSSGAGSENFLRADSHLKTRKSIRMIEELTPELQNDLIRWEGGSAAKIARLKMGEDDKGGSWEDESFSRQSVFGFPDDIPDHDTRNLTFRTKPLQANVEIPASSQDEGIDAAKNCSQCYIVACFDAELPKLCAHEMLRRFLRIALSDGSFKGMDGGAHRTELSKTSFKHSKVTDLAGKMKESGLMSFEHALLYTVAFLRNVRKLPGAQAVLEVVRMEVSDFKSGDLTKASETFEWLVPVCKRWPDHERRKACALAIAFRERLDRTIKIMKEEAALDKGIKGAEEAKRKVVAALKEMNYMRTDRLEKIYRLYDVQRMAEKLKDLKPRVSDDPPLLQWMLSFYDCPPKSPLELKRVFDSLRAISGCSDDFGRTAVYFLISQQGQFVFGQRELRVLLDDPVDRSMRDLFGRTPLHEAASKGFPDIDLLIHKEWIEVKDDEGMTALHYAAQNGHLDIAKSLVKAGASVDTRDISQKSILHWLSRAPEDKLHFEDKASNLLKVLSRNATQLRDCNGRTALHLASISGKSIIFVKKLIELTVELDAGDNLGMSPLHLAARGGHDDVVKELLGRVDVNSQDDDDRTPLSWAAGSGKKEVVLLLLGHLDVKIDLEDNDGQTPLSWAAGNGGAVVVPLLLQANANVNAQDNNERTPLSWAAGNGKEEVVSLLLGHPGVEVDLEDNDSRTPLSWAAGNGGAAVVPLLLQANANVNAKGDDERTPLSWAAGNGNEEVVLLPLNHPDVEVDLKDDDGRTPLSWAAENGGAAVVPLLLQANANVNAKDDDERTPLSWAAGKGNEEVVLLLLENGADVDAKDDGWTALYRAAKSGHETVMRLLLEKGADVNAKDDRSQTILSWAAGNGKTAIVRLLLENRADVNVKGDDGRTALHRAIWNGHEVVVRLLLEKEADVNAEDSSGHTALHDAAGSEREEVVRLLIEKKADVNAKDINGWTPLRWAGGHEAVVRLLVENGADFNVDNDGTALHHAAWSGYEAVVRLLLEKGADAKAKDKDGWTTLHGPAQAGHEIIVRLLLEKGADARAKDKDGWTTLHVAAQAGHEIIVRLLLEKGADVNATAIDGLMPLYCAARSGHEMVVRLLLEKGADAEAKYKDGWTALHHAARSGYEAVVRLLLEKVLDVNAKDSDGQTALHHAAGSGRDEVVRLLLEKGLDVNAKDSDGQTALYWAIKNEHKAVVRLLLEKGADVEAKNNGT
jgi:ankyrin repeat protein